MPDDFLLDDNPPIPFDAVVLSYAAQTIEFLERSLSIASATDPVPPGYQPAMFALLATFLLPAPPVASFATGTDDAVAHFAEVMRHKAREAIGDQTDHLPILIIQSLLRAAMMEAAQHSDEIVRFLRARAALLGEPDPATGHAPPGISAIIASLERNLRQPRLE